MLKKSSSASLLLPPLSPSLLTLLTLMGLFILLGPFRFSTKSLSPQSMEESSSYEWAEIARLGTSPSLQFTGVQSKTLTLPGVLYPHYRNHAGGLLQLRLMEEAASIGAILPLLTGSGGFYHGFWVIAGVRQTKTYLTAEGAALKVDFVLELKKYGDGLEAVRRKAAAEFGKLVTLFS